MNSDKINEKDIVFALDIGTRSIIGVVGTVEDEKVKIIAIEREDHTNRAMIDGQIENIEQVAKIAGIVKSRLEKKLDCKLTRVCVAAAGRALKTTKASYELSLPQIQLIDEEIISKLEAGAIGNAEEAFNVEESTEEERQFYLVGYTVSQYYLDNYPISSLKEHHGKNLKVDVIATFLPSEVVESLYITMHRVGLEIASLTLEPIAAINAAIPENIRLLNLVLVDIGAGTSDIAVCRDGSVVGYTMATIAGDEVTETLMKQYLVDFDTAEKIKYAMNDRERITFTDVLGFEQTVDMSEVLECVNISTQKLCKEISERIIEVNNGAPSAVFLAGGGSKLAGMCEQMAGFLNMDKKRVAISGSNFKISAFSSEYDLDNPEYATPLGIAISSGMNLINDSFRVMLNGENAKLFRSGSLSVRDVLMMNGFSYKDLLGRSGSNITVTLDGKRTTLYGGPSTLAVLKVNGADAKISDIVHAGDVIIFEPAKNGEPATSTIRDLLGDDYADVVLVNGDIVDIDTELVSGDIIETMSESEYQALTNNVNPIDIDSETNSKNIQGEEAISTKEEKIESILSLSEEKLCAVQPTKAKKQFIFTINEKPIVLEEKENKVPFYLMDLIEYSGIDLEHPEGEVILKVNGKNSFFQQELKNNDVVEIYFEKRKL